MSKKNKKKNTAPPLPAVRLSQCMIVKNEEKNIEKALSWAKNIAFEQIVVDTGSADRTIEIAERMGARIFNFQWVNDFSAAKNFAIEQATGNWIVFTDADEYFESGDAKNLMLFLKQFQSDKQSRENYPALGCELLNIDDNGKPTSSSTQLRVFRNLPSLRYTGRIHEKLTVDIDKTIILDGVKIIHTGYTNSAMKEKNKTERNEELLRIELEKNPDDLNIKAYLADVLRLKTDEESRAEADKLFTDVLSSGAGAVVHKELKHKAFIHFANEYAENAEKAIEGVDICNRALKEFPGNLDFEYFLAVALNKTGKKKEASEILAGCESKLNNEEAINESIYISANPGLLQNLKEAILMSENSTPTEDKETIIAQSTFETAAKSAMEDAAKSESHSGLRLSLCMIVKNEEKNITKPLESVKDVAYEMIVVDTGSTDKTVVIAKELGADIYHFEWINDFSAAKNYSIEQAKGDWILILDADEYLTQKDAKLLSKRLEEIRSEPEKWKNCLALSCMIANLDDNGRQMTKFSTVRLFRNIPSIRYVGRIHEQPTIEPGRIVNAEDITIMHTGYSESAHKETGKGKRNLGLLRSELKNNPDDLNLKAYLANSLSMSSNENDQIEAESLIKEILESGESKNVHSVLIAKMYIYMISKYMKDPGNLPECEDMCNKALTTFPGEVDFEYFMAAALTKKGVYDKAWELLKSCEENLINGRNLKDSIMIPADPTVLFSQMILTAKAMNDIENVVMYSTHVLTMDKTRKSILGPCIATLLYYGVTEAETIELLSNIYDFKNPEEAQFVATTAKEYGAAAFAERLSVL